MGAWGPYTVDATGTSSSIGRSGAGSAYTLIDDDPNSGQPDANYIEGLYNTASAEIWLGWANISSPITQVSGATIQIYVAVNGTRSNDDLRLRCGIVTADGGETYLAGATAGTPVLAVSYSGSTTPSSGVYTLQFPYISTSATSTQWDNSYIHLHWDKTKSGGWDNYTLRVHAIEATGTKPQGAISLSVTLDNDNQSFAADVDVTVQLSSTVDNSGQTFAADVDVLSQLSADWTNSPQVFAADVVHTPVTLTADWTNENQSFAADVQVVCTVDADLTNENQAFAADTQVLVQLSADLTNRGQQFAADVIHDPAELTANWTNETQSFAADVQVICTIDALVANASQAFAADVDVLVQLSSTLANRSQTFYAKIGPQPLMISAADDNTFESYYAAKGLGPWRYGGYWFVVGRNNSSPGVSVRYTNSVSPIGSAVWANADEANHPQLEWGPSGGPLWGHQSPEQMDVFADGATLYVAGQMSVGGSYSAGLTAFRMDTRTWVDLSLSGTSGWFYLVPVDDQSALDPYYEAGINISQRTDKDLIITYQDVQEFVNGGYWQRAVYSVRTANDTWQVLGQDYTAGGENDYQTMGHVTLEDDGTWVTYSPWSSSYVESIFITANNTVSATTYRVGGFYTNAAGDPGEEYRTHPEWGNSYRDYNGAPDSIINVGPAGVSTHILAFPQGVLYSPLVIGDGKDRIYGISPIWANPSYWFYYSMDQATTVSGAADSRIKLATYTNYHRGGFTLDSSTLWFTFGLDNGPIYLFYQEFDTGYSYLYDVELQNAGQQFAASVSPATGAQVDADLTNAGQAFSVSLTNNPSDYTFGYIPGSYATQHLFWDSSTGWFWASLYSVAAAKGQIIKSMDARGGVWTVSVDAHTYNDGAGTSGGLSYGDVFLVDGAIHEFGQHVTGNSYWAVYSKFDIATETYLGVDGATTAKYLIQGNNGLFTPSSIHRSSAVRRGDTDFVFLHNLEQEQVSAVYYDRCGVSVLSGTTWTVEATDIGVGGTVNENARVAYVDPSDNSAYLLYHRNTTLYYNKLSSGDSLLGGGTSSSGWGTSTYYYLGHPHRILSRRPWGGWFAGDTPASDVGVWTYDSEVFQLSNTLVNWTTQWAAEWHHETFAYLGWWENLATDTVEILVWDGLNYHLAVSGVTRLGDVDIMSAGPRIDDGTVFWIERDSTPSNQGYVRWRKIAPHTSYFAYNAAQTFAANVSVGNERTLTAALVNDGQQFAADVDVVVAVTASLVNESQTFAADVDVTVTLDSLLVNVSQTFAADLSAVATVTASFVNNEQSFAADVDVVVTVSPALANEGQVFVANLSRAAQLSSALVNSGQQFAADITAVIGPHLTAALINEGQSFAADVDVVVTLSAAVANAGQTFAASVTLVATVDALLVNSGQAFAADVIHAPATVDALLVNQGQSFSADVDVTCQVSASLTNREQDFSASVSPVVQLASDLSNRGQAFAANIKALEGVQVTADLANVAQGFGAVVEVVVGVSADLANEGQLFAAQLSHVKLVDANLTNAGQQFAADASVLVQLSADIQNGPQGFYAWLTQQQYYIYDSALAIVLFEADLEVELYAADLEINTFKATVELDHYPET